MNDLTLKNDSLNLTLEAQSYAAAYPVFTDVGPGTGDVTGPGSATNNNIALFNGATGKIIKDAGKGVPTGAILGTTDSQSVSNKTITASTIGTTNLLSFNAPEGYLINGKIAVTVSSNNITVALKTTADANPSASDPVYCKIGGTIRSITSALSVTKNSGTNWFSSGSTGIATIERDYFVYLGYNATDGVVIGFALIPYAQQYGDFSATTTNQRYCAISTITTAASTDYYNVIGRFAATLSATASFNWSVPTFTAANLIQRPVYETRRLTFTATFTGMSTGTTATAYYEIRGNEVHYWIPGALATSNATTFTITGLPITMDTTAMGLSRNICLVRDNGTDAAGIFFITTGNIVDLRASIPAGAFTNSGQKGCFDILYNCIIL